MKKTVITVFLIIAVLVLAFMVWELVFANNGVLHWVYNGAAHTINGAYANIAGQGEQILAYWGEGETGDISDNNHQNSDRNTDAGVEQDLDTGMQQ